MVDHIEHVEIVVVDVELHIDYAGKVFKIEQGTELNNPQTTRET